MKKILALLLVLLFVGCDKTGDCVKSTGAMAVRNYDGLVFSKIIVNKGIALVIRQGAESKVEVHSGENLIGDIQVTADGGWLVLKDNTDCNWVRDYGQTVVYVTTPELTDIYSKTELSISSPQTLTFPLLHLVSMDSYDTFPGTGTGDFYLNIDNDQTVVDCNTVSRFFISGQTQQLNVSLYASGGIFYGQEFPAAQVNVFHRGSNDIYVHPGVSLSGDIYNIGDVFSVGQPSEVNVTEHYRGKLIFL